MSTALIERDPRAAESPDSIDTWLAVLVRLLHVPPRQREAIRDEIEAHLRERVRDLMISGTMEHDAIRIAISELGEVVDLARRFDQASRHRLRRTIMNLAILGIGALTIGAATIMFRGSPPPASRIAVFDPQAPAASGATRGASPADDKAVSAAFSGQELGLVLQYLAETAGMDLVIDRRALEDVGVALDEAITLNLSGSRPLAQVLEIVSSQLENPIAWRAADGILEVSTSEVFDRRDVVLASFDVQNVLEMIAGDLNDYSEAVATLESLMIEYVEPDAWIVNGGDLGALRVVGGRMFVKAPGRFHEPIQWILSQLEQSAIASATRRNWTTPGMASGGGRGVYGGAWDPAGARPGVAHGLGAPTAPAQPATPDPWGTTPQPGGGESPPSGMGGGSSAAVAPVATSAAPGQPSLPAAGAAPTRKGSAEQPTALPPGGTRP